jgi:hypothetical protein
MYNFPISNFSLWDSFEKESHSAFSLLKAFWRSPFQGCQIVYFQTKNFYMGKFWRVL